MRCDEVGELPDSGLELRESLLDPRIDDRALRESLSLGEGLALLDRLPLERRLLPGVLLDLRLVLLELALLLQLDLLLLEVLELLRPELLELRLLLALGLVLLELLAVLVLLAVLALLGLPGAPRLGVVAVAECAV